MSGEKKLISLKDLRPVAIGNYPEVSVQNLYPIYKDRPEVMDFFPQKLPKGRQLDKQYFFNILNTFLSDE